VSLRTEIGRLERRVRELSSLTAYADLDRDSLLVRVGQLRILQIEARGFLVRLRSGGRLRKATSAASDAATAGGFIALTGGALSVPIFVAIDTAASGAFTAVGFAASAALKIRTRLLRKSVELVEAAQEEIAKHIGAAEAVTLRI
jgi:hypothetical protein